MSEVKKYRLGNTEVDIRRRSCGTPEGAVYSAPNPNVTRSPSPRYHNLKAARGVTPEQHLTQAIAQLDAAANESQLKAAFAAHFNTVTKARCGG